MTKDIQANSEPLPGYRLIERIGAGGYGEVWRVEAPGGLTKAIKFVFGKHHEKRAMNESRALDHIRGVRHPFLLSLERIEVVDGQLLVVTELADGSVKDRFDQCRRDGLRGIPREELLSFLRDAADALDFMSSTHSLQHLDIKPENLLLLAGHVKVADFGLVKDVRQSQASLVGGMTPLYAAPEVFRGSPSRHSDQYSLAIVYQEMLTGTLPFVGNSAAELTLHHLNDEPDLASLTPGDRYSVSRALSKDLEHRYASCREFVDSLVNPASGLSFVEPTIATTATTSAAAAPAAVDSSVRESQPTDFFDDDQPAGWGVSAPQMLLSLPTSDCQLIDLPPVDLAGQDGRPVPTLILGIGGTGARVLAHFRRSVRDQGGNVRDLPAVQFLQIDTDPNGTTELARDVACDFTADEILTLPLRRPQHYRDNAQQLLHWLSRRWLYNIPRSLRTEGLRPLGRLALADHARMAGQRIRRAMVQALDPASVAKSSSVAGKAFRSDALRVIVVSSISGGTGGGMSLDIGYAVRAILQRLGRMHAEVIGLMTHSTGRDARHSELARVNAYSWLTEFNHFQQLETPYPGDVSCGLPSHAAGVPAFDHTYLLNLGDNLDATEFDQATQTVAEYIGFNTLSPASAFFDACRGAVVDDSKSAGTPRLRSFGVYRQSAAPTEFCDEFASVVSERVLSVWRGIEPTTAPGGSNVEDLQFFKRMQLDAGGIAANARKLVELELRTDPATFLNEWVCQQLGAQPPANAAAVLTAIDRAFGRDGSKNETNGAPTLLGRALADIAAPLAQKLSSEVRQSLERRIDDPTQRLAGAKSFLASTTTHFDRIKQELQRIRSAVAERLIAIRAEATTSARNQVLKVSNSNVQSSAQVEEYFLMCLDHVTIVAGEHVVHVIAAECKAVVDEFMSLGREIDQMISAVKRAATQAGDRQVSDVAGQNRLEMNLRAKLADIAAMVDGWLLAECLEANGGLAKTVLSGGRLRAQLNSKLNELSRKAVYQSLAGANSAETNVGEHGAGGDLRGALAMATPMLLEYGGRRRVLAILPAGSANQPAEAAVSQTLGAAATMVEGRDIGTTVCVEADGLSLPHVALEFVERRRDRVEFAGRVHCRTDVSWSPLISADAAVAEDAWGSPAPRQTVDQHAMSKTLVM